ncbi:hypothetical protein CVT24_008586 [Panaeolus cyanescens]|uniref:Uncharacterized protein n=1 Tax=Panaeolus cyanescens TaxID=181874 RepID=A0A409W4B0_9AGAR|nr:hypothetical protein CVT24_008586 [Panaeolus cyanescens]
MPSPRNYSASPRKLPCSSDTEQYYTPPRKRFRDFEDDDLSSPASSQASFRSSPRKRQRKDTPKRETKEINLEEILRKCAKEPTSRLVLQRIKELPRDEHSPQALVEELVASAMAAVKSRWNPSKGKMLETELYLGWLKELGYVGYAIESALAAKVPGTRKRLSGFGRASFTILYHMMEEFISQVNLYHDRWSLPPSEADPLIMTLAEETKDSTADERSEEASRSAEKALRSFDTVMADAARRYKAECGRNNPGLAAKISAMEAALAKSCCLLSEQTGYGSEESDVADTLLEEVRGVMKAWKAEYEDCEDQLIDSDDEPLA